MRNKKIKNSYILICLSIIILLPIYITCIVHAICRQNMNLKVQLFLLAQYSHTEVHSISTKGIFREIDVHLRVSQATLFHFDSE